MLHWAENGWIEFSVNTMPEIPVIETFHSERQELHKTPILLSTSRTAFRFFFIMG